jgi:hypothetical protein
MGWLNGRRSSGAAAIHSGTTALRRKGMAARGAAA